jgi:hypothetical protein
MPPYDAPAVGQQYADCDHPFLSGLRHPVCAATAAVTMPGTLRGETSASGHFDMAGMSIFH